MTHTDYEAIGYTEMASRRDWRLADCRYTGWQRDAWRVGAWRWMCEQRLARRVCGD